MHRRLVRDFVPQQSKTRILVAHALEIRSATFLPILTFLANTSKVNDSDELFPNDFSQSSLRRIAATDVKSTQCHEMSLSSVRLYAQKSACVMKGGGFL